MDTFVWNIYVPTSDHLRTYLNIDMTSIGVNIMYIDMYYEVWGTMIQRTTRIVCCSNVILCVTFMPARERERETLIRLIPRRRALGLGIWLKRIICAYTLSVHYVGARYYNKNTVIRWKWSSIWGGHGLSVYLVLEKFIFKNLGRFFRRQKCFYGIW